jgi:hypothetical protein
MSVKKYAMNTQTGRYCTVGSKTYIRAKKGGFIKEAEPTPQQTKPPTPQKTKPPTPQPEPPTPHPEPPTPEPELDNNKFKSKLAEECSEIVNKHKEQFKGISQKQTDTLLRRMLYEKLCLSDKKDKQAKSKKAKSKKAKFKLKEPSSSDQSSSESESD